MNFQQINATSFIIILSPTISSVQLTDEPSFEIFFHLFFIKLFPQTFTATVVGRIRVAVTRPSPLLRHNHFWRVLQNDLLALRCERKHINFSK